MEHLNHHQTRKSKFGKVVGWIFLGILSAIGFAIVLGYVIMLLWNWLMPEIFGLIAITYWQAVGLFLLVKLFIGGFGHHKSENRKDKFHDRFKQKFSKENISKWKHYNQFWKEKGEQAYNEYLEQIVNEQ